MVMRLPSHYLGMQSLFQCGNGRDLSENKTVKCQFGGYVGQEQVKMAEKEVGYLLGGKKALWGEKERCLYSELLAGSVGPR